MQKILNRLLTAGLFAVCDRGATTNQLTTGRFLHVATGSFKEGMVVGRVGGWRGWAQPL